MSHEERPNQPRRVLAVKIPAFPKTGESLICGDECKLAGS